MIDRLGRPLGDRSRPRRPPRTAGPTAEHHVRRLGSISLPSCVSHNSLGPRRRIGRPSRLRVCLDDKAAAAAEPRHGDCRGVGTKGLKLAQPRPSLGRKNAFQGQKLRSRLDNRHRGGEREPLREAGGRTEPTHGRGAARGGEGWRSGGGGVGQSMEIRAFPCWAGCHFGNGRTRRVWVLSALEKEAKGAGRHGVRRGVASINDDSDRGVKVFLKVRVLSAEREGLVRALMGGGGQWCHRDDFDNGSRFLAGIELLGQKLHAGDPTKTGPWSCG